MSTGYAYQWLTESQKANILSVLYSYGFNKYFIKLEFPDDFLYFHYKYEYGSTVVSYEREELLVAGELVKVFLDDLELILKNQKLKLGQLHMQVEPNIFQEHYHGFQETLTTIFERLEEVLTERKEKLLVSRLSLYPYTVKQGISILKYLDPKELTFFEMRFYQGVEAADMENILGLVEWNRKKRIYFELLIFSITLEHLEVIKKLTSYNNTFDVISIMYAEIVELDLKSYFTIHFLQEPYKITFELEGSDSEEGETVEEDFENLVLEDYTVRKALENYLVLKNVLKELQLFDIQHLRKVNRGIRWLIDAHLHPNPHIKNNLEICVESLNSEDVEYLKTNLLLKSNFQKFKITFHTNAIDGSLHTLIGEPYRIITVSKKIWYFRIPNSKYYMHLLLDTHEKLDIYKQQIPKMIVFSRVEKGDTPFA
ncbi:hypothetical protein B9Z55_016024 [Caenorhabditis nigoni]|uniref:DUF38 domain-containing protein n=1 Tax=Caenorhabditis nigoni TaxID=1611254 RepID=A0A2G5UCV1_9PELO|nr:hypothetical protein B9Z55_016024 [Caenorhabditis nigoni]